MITRALFDGEIIIGVVVVEREIEDLGSGKVYSGGDGRVRSNVGVVAE